MVRSSTVVSLLASTAGFFSQVDAKKAVQQDDNIVLGSYIVEFEDAADNSEFYNTIQNVATTDMELDFKLFKGASITFTDAGSAEEQAAQLAQLGSVKQMWPKRIYSLPKTEVQWTDGSSAASQTANLRRQTENNATFAPHVMTQVDKMHEKGFLGAGIKVAVIDSGIDYTHPALGGAFGPGHLVSYGHDIVGDNYDGTNTPVEDNDPYDGCGGHGTHVAGIIAAQANNKYGILGAAPGVTIGAYRVFGCEGSAANDVLIRAYMMAFEAGSQIITASIGGASGWSEDPWAVAVSRIVEQGVPCTVSAGNDGAMGLFYASTASDGTRVTSIASFDNEYTPTLSVESSYTIGSGQATTFGYTPGEPAAWANVTRQLYAANFDTTKVDDACTAFPDDTPDLSDKIVLIRRGSCTFVTKATNAAAKGAKYIIFYNNVAVGASGPAIQAVNGILGSAGVSASQGATWVQALAAGETVTVAMADPETGDKILTYNRNLVTGGYASSYTTWNPTFELEVKPQIAAPGGNILSTYPVTLGSYAVLSGTSMSCPLAAGIYALIAEARGTFDPATIENLLAATSKAAQYNNNAGASPMLAPVVQQGAGIIQAYDAAFASTILSRSSIAFNDTDYLEPTANFTIKNLGDKEVSFDIAHVGAATAYTFSTEITVDPFPGMDVTPEYAGIALSESKVTIPAGGETTVSLTVTPPSVDGKRLPVYSGFITLNGTNGDNLSLPYNGVVGSMNAVQIVADAWLSLSSDAAHTPITGNGSSFVLPRNPATGGANVTYPVASVDMVFGTRKLDMQLVKLPCNGTATTTGGKKLGSIKNAPLSYIPRDDVNVPFDGTLADGSIVPAGNYLFEFSALHIFGDIEDPTEYEVRRSAPFAIRYV